MGQSFAPTVTWNIYNEKRSENTPNRYTLTSATASNQGKSDLKGEKVLQYLCCCFCPKRTFILPFKQKFVFKPVAGLKEQPICIHKNQL